MHIHPTAIIAAEAQIHDTVEIGPYCTIGPKASIGPHTKLMSHVVIDGICSIGSENAIFPFVTLGLVPQDLKYAGEASSVTIGDRNTFREGCTVHAGTKHGDMLTSIGNDNLFMANSHVAHDCHVGNHVIMANCSSLAGHVIVEDYAILGGLSGVHQFCNIGTLAFLSGGAKATQDVPPYCLVQGDRARIIGINIEGLRRSGWNQERITTFKDFFRFFFNTMAPLEKRISDARTRWSNDHGDIEHFLSFLERSHRGHSPYGRRQSE